MSDYQLIALTGSIGSGKSSAAKFFEEFGAVIIDADDLARRAVIPGSDALKKISEEFGPQYLSADGTLNRTKLGECVFNDPVKLKQLEKIVHPAIRDLFLEEKQLFESTKNINQNLLIYVIPLYFETSYKHPDIREVIVVAAPQEECLSRIIARDGCSKELAINKLNSQIPIEEKVKNADYVINNDGDLNQLKERVYALYQKLTKKV